MVAHWINCRPPQPQKVAIFDKIATFSLLFVPKNCNSIFATFSESPKDAYLMLIFQKPKKPWCLSIFWMPFTGAKRLWKPRRSGNREMETALCKPQNFSPKNCQNFSDFHNKLFFGLWGSQSRSGRRGNRHFCTLCTKAVKSRPKTLEGNPQLFCGILLPGRTPFSYFWDSSIWVKKLRIGCSEYPRVWNSWRSPSALRNGRKSSEFR